MHTSPASAEKDTNSGIGGKIDDGMQKVFASRRTQAAQIHTRKIFERSLCAPTEAKTIENARKIACLTEVGRKLKSQAKDQEALTESNMCILKPVRCGSHLTGPRGQEFLCLL